MMIIIWYLTIFIMLAVITWPEKQEHKAADEYIKAVNQALEYQSANH